MARSFIWKLFDTRHMRGMLRVFVFFTVSSGIGVAAFLPAAAAGAETRIEDVGRQLMDHLGPQVIGRPQRVLINGQSMYIASNVTPLAPQQVMDRFEVYCREQSGDLADAIGALPSTFQGKPVPDSLRDPTGWLTERVNQGDEDFGQINCLARNTSGGFPVLLEQIADAFDSGDLARVGDFRYVVARKTARGQTHVLAMWTQGKFNVREMFPETGDAPGEDPKQAPRPPESERILSSVLPGHPYALGIYESKRTPGQVLSFYDRAMRDRGYHAEAVWLESDDSKETTATPSYARVFSKDGRLILVGAVLEPVFEQGTQVSIVQIDTAHARAVVRSK
jgi:hypothetical protein